MFAYELIHNYGTSLCYRISIVGVHWLLRKRLLCDAKCVQRLVHEEIVQCYTYQDLLKIFVMYNYDTMNFVILLKCFDVVMIYFISISMP